ncbi:MAG TPA: hypothetical protein V6D47_02500, partial [Oscillatoriaceae cyanobacterium]
HAGDGLISVDSPVIAPYTLGEFFALWNVSLDGALVYANGSPVSEPKNMVFEQHQEIVVMFGKPPAKIPGDYSGKWPF